MSPEGAIFAIEEYVQSLKRQAAVAEAFFYGRIGEGMEGFFLLPESVRLQVDQLVWEASQGGSLELSDEKTGPLIAEALLFALEERMGMQS